MDFPEEEEISYIENENAASKENDVKTPNNIENDDVASKENEVKTPNNVEPENVAVTNNDETKEKDYETAKLVETENFSTENGVVSEKEKDDDQTDVVSDDQTDVPDLHSSELESVPEIGEDGRSDDIPE